MISSGWPKPSKAIILARGLGTRMKVKTANLSLTSEQNSSADAGLKGLVPLANGRTLLEMGTENLREAGFEQIIVVIGPEHDLIREHCERLDIRIEFAVQKEALGTADAVLAAEQMISDDELFAVFNSDNLYPVSALKSLVSATCPAMLAFDKQTLINESDIPVERLAKFATVEIDNKDELVSITEKPQKVSSNSYISMNAWLFSPVIFKACRAITPSERGEYEVTSAVNHLIGTLNEKIKAIKVKEGVLDLSTRADIETAARFLNKA